MDKTDPVPTLAPVHLVVETIDVTMSGAGPAMGIMTEVTIGAPEPMEVPGGNFPAALPHQRILLPRINLLASRKRSSSAAFIRHLPHS